MSRVAASCTYLQLAAIQVAVCGPEPGRQVNLERKDQIRSVRASPAPTPPMCGVGTVCRRLAREVSELRCKDFCVGSCDVVRLVLDFGLAVKAKGRSPLRPWKARGHLARSREGRGAVLASASDVADTSRWH